MKTKTKKSDISLAITTLPPSPDDERRGRMRRYALTTLIRLVCILIAFVLPLGWWTILPIVGAVFLPFFAVVVANVGHEGVGGVVERPGSVELYRPENVYHPEEFQGETYRMGEPAAEGDRPETPRPETPRPDAPRPETDR
jgi:hypothetical protein